MVARRDFIRQTGIVSGSILFTAPGIGQLIFKQMKDDQLFDVIIIGGSYSGLAAAMALGRALRKVLVIDGGQPCNQATPHSHNFLTQDGQPPGEIARIARHQVMAYDTIRLHEGFVISGVQNENSFQLQTENGETFLAQKLVFATGIKELFPSIPGFNACWGKSVLHCPYCHGYEVRQQPTGILASGDTAFELASLLSNWTSDLTIFSNGNHGLSEAQETKLKQHQITIVTDEIQEFVHKDGYIDRISFVHGHEKKVKAVYARLPFQQHSSVPQSMGCEITPEGYIKIDGSQKTTIPGIYACGDNVTRMRTVANAVAMGTTTGLMVNKELIEAHF